VTDPTTTRAITVGLPPHLRAVVPLRVRGVVDMSGDLAAATAFTTENPHVVVIYGQELFGNAVTGQPVYLLPDQVDVKHHPRVMLLAQFVDRAELAWDDPRLFMGEAGVRLHAKHLIDANDERCWLSLDILLDRVVQPPR